MRAENNLRKRRERRRKVEEKVDWRERGNESIEHLKKGRCYKEEKIDSRVKRSMRSRRE